MPTGVSAGLSVFYPSDYSKSDYIKSCSCDVSIPLITVDLITSILITSNLAVLSFSLPFIVLFTLDLALATSKLFQND